MSDYIKREDALQAVNGIHEDDLPRNSKIEVCDVLMLVPSADVAPVRRGKWVRDGVDKWRCSVCGIGNNYAYKWSVSDGDELQDKYCPYCGAKMGGDVDEID